jgi:ubiquinone/menaquinone biosynthesis C-methylase UbiE
MIQDERTDECPTNTQFKVMLSGYQWACKQLGNIGELSVLDNACGSGYGSDYLSNFAKTVTGIDISEITINKCKTKYRRNNLNFRIMDGTKLAFQDNSFDAVISQDTIEHVQNDQLFLSEIGRVLKPGGKLVIFTPFSLSDNKNPKNKYHIREYSKAAFNDLLSRNLKVINMYGRSLGPELKDLEDDLTSIRKLDKYGIRDYIPRPARHFIASIFAKLKGDIALDSISLEHVRYSETFDCDVTTMAAVCAKV